MGRRRVAPTWLLNDSSRERNRLKPDISKKFNIKEIIAAVRFKERVQKAGRHRERGVYVV